MPERGQRPEWERENNRTQIIFTLLEKSLTFTELLNETGLARSTLSNHLKELQEQQIIEKAIENGRVVYRTMLNEEIIESEMQIATYDLLLKLLSKERPGAGLFLKLLVKWSVHARIINKKREIEGKKPLTKDELIKEATHAVFNSLSQDEVDPDELMILQSLSQILNQLENEKENSI